MKKIKLSIISLATLLFSLISLANGALREDALSIYFSPDSNGNHLPLIQGIQSAKKSIQMVIFHIDDRDVEAALIAARARGVKVQVIVDEISLNLPPFAFSFRRLQKGGVEAVASSKGFKITHQKTMVVDDSVAYVTSMNLTKKAETTRDWGVITSDAGVIREMDQVFAADLANARTGGTETPPLQDPHLLWSPVNSETKLVSLIQSAHRSLESTVENLGNPAIQKAFEDAAARGVKVRLIVPLCDIAVDQHMNVPFAQQMANLGVQVQLMPDPETQDQPYMHAKMIVADGSSAYVGSVNFSDNSTHNSREAGIIFQNQKAISTLQTQFEKDWAHSLNLQQPFPSCGGSKMIWSIFSSHAN